MSNSDFRTLLRSLAQHGLLCFPNHILGTPAFAAFARRFGDLEVNVAILYHAPDFPEIMILPNQTRPDGRPAPDGKDGLPDRPRFSCYFHAGPILSLLYFASTGSFTSSALPLNAGITSLANRSTCSRITDSGTPNEGLIETRSSPG